VIGVTGPPGVGKSSLCDRLTTAWRRAGRRVGVVAVDPSSPFSGGALLGDRIRMAGHFTDPGVFIRSMATRGHLGGLAAATADVVDVLDAAGFDQVLVETIGVGQEDLEVAQVAHLVLLVLAPGLGDEIQVMKSGIMEIGDVLVVHKCDLPGADRAEAALRAVLAGAGAERERPVVRAAAATGEGVDAVLGAIGELEARLAPAEAERRRLERARQRVSGIVQAALRARVRQGALAAGEWRELEAAVAARSIDPYRAAERVLKAMTEAGSERC
jgi:LAO/AO transport system kinase